MTFQIREVSSFQQLVFLAREMGGENVMAVIDGEDGFVAVKSLAFCGNTHVLIHGVFCGGVAKGQSMTALVPAGNVRLGFTKQEYEP